MYKKLSITMVLVFSLTVVSESFSMEPEKSSTTTYWSTIKNGGTYLALGFYHGVAKTVTKNPLGVCFNLWQLWIEKDFVKENPGKSCGLACNLLVPILYNGFFEHQIKNSLLQTLVDTPFHIGLAIQKLCFDREGIRNHPLISAFVALNIVYTFERNYKTFNAADGLEVV